MRGKKKGKEPRPVVGDGVPDGATGVKITSISEGRKTVQITVAYADGETGEEKSVTLHLRQNERHGYRWEDRQKRAWAIIMGPQDLPKRPPTKAELRAEEKAGAEATKRKKAE